MMLYFFQDFAEEIELSNEADSSKLTGPILNVSELKVNLYDQKLLNGKKAAN